MSVIAITGVSGCLGTQLLQQADVDGDVTAVLGIDQADPPEGSAKLIFERRSITEPLEDLFVRHGVDTAIHLAADDGRDRAHQRAVNVDGTRRFLEACHAAGVETICVLSDAATYGARPENVDYLYEGSPLKATAYPLAEDKIAVEGLCFDYIKDHPDVCLQIVRPCTIVGPHATNHLAARLKGRVLFAPWGYDPPLQLVHEDDATRAIYRLVKLRRVGIFNLAADGAMTLSHMARVTEKRLVRVPAPLLWLFVWLGWRLGLCAYPPGYLAYWTHPWLIAPVKLRTETLLVFRFDAPRAFLDAVEARDAAYGGFLFFDDDIDDLEEDELEDLDEVDDSETPTPVFGVPTAADDAPADVFAGPAEGDPAAFGADPRPSEDDAATAEAPVVDPAEEAPGAPRPADEAEDAPEDAGEDPLVRHVGRAQDPSDARG